MSANPVSAFPQSGSRPADAIQEIAQRIAEALSETPWARQAAEAVSQTSWVQKLGAALALQPESAGNAYPDWFVRAAETIASDRAPGGPVPDWVRQLAQLIARTAAQPGAMPPVTPHNAWFSAKRDQMQVLQQISDGVVNTGQAINQGFVALGAQIAAASPAAAPCTWPAALSPRARYILHCTAGLRRDVLDRHASGQPALFPSGDELADHIDRDAQSSAWADIRDTQLSAYPSLQLSFAKLAETTGLRQFGGVRADESPLSGLVDGYLQDLAEFECEVANEVLGDVLVPTPKPGTPTPAPPSAATARPATASPSPPSPSARPGTKK